MSVIAVFNQKGGVGKTTTALNLSAALVRNGYQPLLIDLDPHAHLTSVSGVGVESDESIYAFYKEDRPLTELVKVLENGVHLIPSHVELAKVDTLMGRNMQIIMKLRNALFNEMMAQNDVPVIIDCCPMLGILSLNAIAAADGVLIPMSAEYLAVKGAVQLESTLVAMERMVQKPIPRRMVLTRFVTKRRLTQDIVEQMEERYGNKLCRTRIHECSSLTESAGFNQDIFTFAPKSKGARDYGFLLDELVDSGFINVTK